MKEKINFKLLSKTQKVFVILSFLIFLTVSSIIWKIISAQNVPSINTNIVGENKTSSALDTTTHTTNATTTTTIPLPSSDVSDSSDASGSSDLSGSSAPSTSPDPTATTTSTTTPRKEEIKTATNETALNTESRSEVLTETHINTITTLPSPITNSFPTKAENLGLIVEKLNTEVISSKEQLTKTINQNVTDIISTNEVSNQETDIVKINTLHNELLTKIDSSLSTSATVTPARIDNLKTEINKGISDIKSATGKDMKAEETNDTSSENIANTLDTLSETVRNTFQTLSNEGGDLLYKDSNQDGISDYESIYVYNIDPNIPTPVSTYQGRTINASEKILLGFDPTESELVKVNKEEPIWSSASVVSTYKVKNVALTADKKEVVLKGQALPNSFITLYIYSTPIIVTVKTNSDGEWEYILDKELENGEHTVYVATVNNSGNIVAKSSGFLFTKTAEAVTLSNIPIAEASVNTQGTDKPSLFKDYNFYGIILVVILFLVLMIILTGMTVKTIKKK